VASWLIFGVAHSLRIDSDMLVVTASPARTALKISQLIRQAPDDMPPTYDSMHQARASLEEAKDPIRVFERKNQASEKFLQTGH
jgi:hypothetical protein